MTGHQPQSDLPDLRIVSVSDLVLHEEYDAQRSQLMTAHLQSDGILKNPPVVAAINGDQRYVVLDGANRVTALQLLGFSHSLVQVVNCEDQDLILDSWYHLVSGIPCRDFNRAVGNVAGLYLSVSSLNHARVELARRSALAYMVCPDTTVCTIHAEGDLHQRATRLNELVNVYKSQGVTHRVNTDHLDSLLPFYDDVTVLVVFPCYQLVEIIELARANERLPAGITRFVIPRRALRINFPLNALCENCSITEKNRRLKNWLKEKISKNEVRFYQESTFAFDE